MNEGQVPEVGAIPTVYNGTQFRSRTEARWAIFFDALGVHWGYEPNAYELDGKRYLPDFWLPEHDCFWEVKGVEGLGSEKAMALARLTMKAVFIASGSPAPGHEVEVYFPDGYDQFYQWCRCSKCGLIGLQFSGRSERNRCGCFDPNKDEEYTSSHPRIVEAYTKAASHRFWDPK